MVFVHCKLHKRHSLLLLPTLMMVVIGEESPLFFFLHELTKNKTLFSLEIFNGRANTHFYTQTFTSNSEKTHAFGAAAAQKIFSAAECKFFFTLFLLHVLCFPFFNTNKRSIKASSATFFTHSQFSQSQIHRTKNRSLEK